VFKLALLVALASIATEAVVEIITKSDLFSSMMGRAALRKDLLSRLITCPYCLSVWVAGFFSLCIYMCVGFSLWLFLILTFSIHRISNMVHVVQDKLSVKSNRKTRY